MEHFHDRTENEGVGSGRLFVLKQPDTQRRGHETSQAGGRAAGNAGVAADIPVRSRDIPLNAANQAGDDARDRIEEHTGRQRPQVADVQQHLAVINSEMRGKHGAATVDQADQQPVPPGHLPGAHPFPDQHGQHHVQQRDPGHFQNHDQHRFYLINITYTRRFVRSPGFFCL